MNNQNNQLFWIDPSRSLKVTYGEFISNLINPTLNNIYIKEINPYQVFVQILKNALSNKRSILIDCDFSTEELKNIGITEEDIVNGEYYQEPLSQDYSRIEEIIRRLKQNKDFIEIDIFTSGTTGRPKKVTQSIENLTRGVREGDVYKENIWAFAYNPTHFAGMQVFFQAFYNCNLIIYVFSKNFPEIFENLVAFKITHLSCTPTFLKILLSYIKSDIKTVRSVTLGGERFDVSLENMINDKFPNALIRNVYASTEAGSLLVSDGEFFEIPKKYKELIKIESSELLINKSLMGASEIFKCTDQWYHTGDLVELYRNGKFKFKSRKSEMINVGGYKVNPTEIENVIKSVEGVRDVVVFGRKNSVLGEIVVANVVKWDDYNEIFLKESIRDRIVLNLQEYKIPSLINIVERFELTRTAKIKRNGIH